MVTCFRPLSGNYISQNHLYFSAGRKHSFRPLSGNYISQKSYHSIGFALSVSVPCRGTTFLNMETVALIFMNSFPSPVGELHFSMSKMRTDLLPYIVSVPCRGTTFLNPSLQSRHQSGLMVGIAWKKYFWKNK